LPVAARGSLSYSTDLPSSWVRQTKRGDIPPSRGSSVSSQLLGGLIVIGNLGLRIDLKILIADIASANKRDCVVYDHQLVVHPVVEPRTTEHEFEGTEKHGMAAIRERVEYSNFNLRMIVQRHELFIDCNRLSIIDQHAHAYTAVGRSQHGLGQQLTGLILAKNKVLKR
jgi:hypothetical protein